MPVLDVEVAPEMPLELAPEIAPVPTTKELSVAGALDRAADILSEPGKWIKGCGHREGAYCAAGAVIVAVDPTYYVCGTGFKKNESLYKQALRVLARVLNNPHDNSAIVYFNDRASTRQEDVVATLRVGAQLARHEQM